MIIEIRKVNFINKGAELMLLAIIEKLRNNYPNAKLVMAPDNNRIGYPSGKDYVNRAKLGLYQKTHFRKYGIAWDKVCDFIPKQIRDRFGIVTDKEIDIVLDAAGFGYGEQQGITNTVGTALDVERWKKNNTKVIFMPQALGPFKNDKIKNAFKTILEKSDRIYARDEVSFRYCEELNIKNTNLLKSPDFTNLLKGIVPLEFDTSNNKVCIVPNIRMVDKTSKEESNLYPIFMSKCLKILVENNSKPFFLIHEGKEDLDLAKRIMKLADVDVNIVVEEDPLKIKGIISLCDGMVGSRFHGVVSTLSQGIPAIVTGWSHKYEMLLADYSFEEGLLSVNSNNEDINKALSYITDKEKRNNIKKIIYDKAQEEKKKVEAMWTDIFNIIDSYKK